MKPIPEPRVYVCQYKQIILVYLYYQKYYLVLLVLPHGGPPIQRPITVGRLLPEFEEDLVLVVHPRS